jgi:hypothetical protein
MVLAALAAARAVTKLRQRVIRVQAAPLAAEVVAVPALSKMEQMQVLEAALHMIVRGMERTALLAAAAAAVRQAQVPQVLAPVVVRLIMVEVAAAVGANLAQVAQVALLVMVQTALLS